MISLYCHNRNWSVDHCNGGSKSWTVSDFIVVGYQINVCDDSSLLGQHTVTINDTILSFWRTVASVQLHCRLVEG
jgi:hypothetical protein